MIATLGASSSELARSAFQAEDVGMYYGRNLAAGYGSSALTGQDISLSRCLNLAVGHGAFTLSGGYAYANQALALRDGKAGSAACPF